MVSATWVLLGAVFALLGYLYRRLNAVRSHWEERGVAHESPLLLFGSCLPMATLAKSKAELLQDIYDRHPGRPYVGFFDFVTPNILVRDPELVGKILIKDFGHFVDHGLELNEEHNWIDLNLFALKGTKWRALRNKMSPAFSTGKLKGMHPQMVHSAQEMVRRIRAKEGQDVDVKDEMSLYTSEAIGSIVFGLDTSKQDSVFREMGKKALDLTIPRYIATFIMFSVPWLGKMLRISFTPKDVSQYFSKIILDTFEYRAKNNVIRNDFVQLMMQLRDKGYVEFQSKDVDDEYLEMGMTPTTETIELSEKILVAQAYTFLLAGFEPMAGAIMFTTVELAKRPEVQARAREEVRQSVARHGGFTYQALKEMTYLEMILQEAMRMNPISPFLMRVVTKPYRLEDGTVLETGTILVIPTLALQRDPAYWADPEQFLPERFAPEAARVPYTNLPFGDGPRLCIGMRFAMLQIKQAVASVVHDFKMEFSPNMKLPIKLKKNAFTSTPVEPVLIRFLAADA